MKKFFSVITAISTALAAIYGIMALLDRLKNRQPDVVYFDTKDDEEK